MKNNRLLISFSGGETSAYMAKLLLDQYRGSVEILVLFANTGQEAEETLVFVKECDRVFNLNLVWIEADVQPERGIGTKAKTTDFWDASRNGEPFRDAIKKYGIPNVGNPICKRELKIVPMQSYIRSVGWKKNSYTTAIGIRADEMDRMSNDAEASNFIYPLVDWNIDKAKVNDFWHYMPFRLNLKGWEGNCKTCWAKSNRKLYQIAKDHPDWYDFFSEMEFLYRSFTPERRKGSTFRENGSYRRTIHNFFSKQRDTTAILEHAWLQEFEPPSNDRQSLFDEELDSLSQCFEGCDVFWVDNKSGLNIMTIKSHEHWIEPCKGTQLSLGYDKGQGFKVYSDPCHRDNPESPFVMLSLLTDESKSQMLYPCKRMSEKSQAEAIALFDQVVEDFIAKNPIPETEVFSANPGDQFIVKRDRWDDKTIVIESQVGDRFNCFDVSLYWESDTPLTDNFTTVIYQYSALSKAERIEPMPSDKLEKMRDSMRLAQRNREEAAAERERFIEVGRSMVPDWAVAAIVARCEENKSDSNADYHGSITKKKMVLAFSKSKKDDFNEMRRAAVLCDETAHLVDPKFENREKYSLGNGYYLGHSRYDGWQIGKEKMILNSEFLAALGEHGLPKKRIPKKMPPNPEPISAPETVEVIIEPVELSEKEKTIEVDRLIEIGRSLVPDWAKSTIVAQFEKHWLPPIVIEKKLILGFSKYHTPGTNEIRDAVLLCDETAHMKDKRYPEVSDCKMISIDISLSPQNRDFLYYLGKYGFPRKLPDPIEDEVSPNPEPIQDLEPLEISPTNPESIQEDGIRVVHNQEKDGIEVFLNKPSSENLNKLVSFGFRRTFQKGVWFSKFSEEKYAAIQASFTV
ncbi:phosphoadenosine phosphosulfate reductase family protein [Pseudanabaena sp. 'Roaring Creek']|uniref:phosphoadenosine phosphosulfate reductase domain-containing protein n=1 Tax=Pseudanabaena sp. 'Roaring Creek' TaxID=1681830 RepID=UPI0006D7E49C|nr:phosphoadenosine phosphosulfate reductase family protein [Pseudanabaena sp. 'Roaring Creek']